MQVHVFTVGTSVLRNIAGDRVAGVLRRAGVDPSVAYSLHPEDPAQARLEELAEDERVVGEVAGRVVENPRAYSAELNAFMAFVEERGLGGGLSVVLLHTDTGSGLFSSRVLGEALRRMGYGVERSVRVAGFGLGAERMMEALANLMDEMAGVKLRHGGSRLYLNATGGYKPESAFAVVSALLLGYNAAYYIHEAFRGLVVLPSPPLELRGDYRRRLGALLGLGSAPLSYLFDNEGWGQADVEDLVERGLVALEGGVVRLREWVRVLLGLGR